MIPPKIGILLVNLGTPESAKTADVRQYLNEFLTDGRVIDIPWISRQLLVRGIISPFRAGSSAKSYKAIWDSETGSPLKYYTQRQAELLQAALNKESERANQPIAFKVAWCMRYQTPSINMGLTELRAANCNQYIVLPLFPQYASATTGSAHQKVMEVLSTWQTIPPVSFVNSYQNNSLFIKAFANIGATYQPRSYDHVLFSFHGLPQRQLIKADDNNYCLQAQDCCDTLTEKNQFCYSAQCHNTAHLLADALNLPASKYTITFQSRLGKEPWMQPYTNAVLEELAKKGCKKVLVFCPAFTADCLETIFEIGVEYQEEFEEFGGEKVQLVESLNDHPDWIEAMKQLVLSQVQIPMAANKNFANTLAVNN